jgi:hypothetical protein
MLRAFFIDPFKGQVCEIEIAYDIHVWRKLLMCDCLDVARLQMIGEPRLILDIWVDDNCMIREPEPWPMWRVRGSELAGYGLVTMSDPAGETISLRGDLTVGMFVTQSPLLLEAWESRLKIEDFHEQLMRSVELEQPTLVHYRGLVPR